MGLYGVRPWPLGGRAQGQAGGLTLLQLRGGPRSNCSRGSSDNTAECLLSFVKIAHEPPPQDGSSTVAAIKQHRLSLDHPLKA